MKPGHTYHVHLCVPSFLKRSNRQLEGMLSMDGKSMTGAEVREFLKSQLEAGRECFSGCDNMGEDGRCMGHKLEDSQ